MKSAVSSSSSGSERVSGTGVTSSAGYDLEENKSKSNSRMSCASDDSCAINELLEGRMDLNVSLPNSDNSVVINVERRTPMLDLLVNISTQYRFNAANYTINAGEHEFKASTPIGTLDVNQISIIPKSSKSNSLKSNSPSVIPFQTTFRLQVNLPRNQLMVMRVTPNATITAVKQIICSEKALDVNKYQLVRFNGNCEGPQILDPIKTLAFYTLNEVTLVSNKTLSQIELQYGTPSASQVDLSRNTTSASVSSNKKSNNISLLISQSTPDFSTIDDKMVLNHTTTKQLKKRPAPPPPTSSSSTLPNKLMANQINSYKEGNNETNLKNIDSMNTSDESVSQNIIETKPVLRVTKSVVSHVRQNSGSDSSGYHESVLSSDSPESSSAATLPKSNTMADTISTSKLNNKQISASKSGTKKRRAPLPPSTNQLTGAEQLKNINDNKSNDNNIDESKVITECMSDVSLPLSTSSSSSGTASSINNRSLSPIVITQTNGSSTPLRTSMNSKQTLLELESAQLSSTFQTKSEEISEELDRNQTQMPVICVQNEKDIKFSENDDKVLTNSASHLEHSIESTELDTIPPSLHVRDDEVDREVLQVMPQEIPKNFNQNETEIEKISDNLKIKEMIDILETNQSISNDSSEPSINSKDSKSTEPLLKKVEVSCTAPALAVSHDNGLSGHECVEQVMERNIASNFTDNSKPGSIVMPISEPLWLWDQKALKNSRAVTTAPTIANNSLHCININHRTNGFEKNKSNFRSYLDDIRRAYLHDMKGDGNLRLLLTGLATLMATLTLHISLYIMNN